MQLRVLHRTGQSCPAVRIGDVVVYDQIILPPWQVEGRPSIDRSWVLLSERVQLTQPALWTGPLEHGWYIDMVSTEPIPGGLAVHDLYLDIVIPPSGRRYEILDLDELADAVDGGDVTSTGAGEVLRDAQRFLTRHLNDPGAGPADAWPDFPPQSIQDLPVSLRPGSTPGTLPQG